MLLKLLHTTFIALAVSTITVSAAPGLSVKVTGPEAVTGVDNLKVKTTITNTGDELLKILNHPDSPLSQLPADTFKITGAKGGSPSFIGIRAKYVPSAAIGAGKDAVTVLAPGQFVEVEHNLSEAYNFTRSGEGAYTFEANNRFYIVDSSNEAVPLYAKAQAHTAELTGKLAVVHRAQLKHDATFNNCTPDEQSQLNTAADSAQIYATTAYSYLASRTTITPRYKTWFGLDSNLPKSHFEKISNNTFSSYKYDCTCKTTGTYAYVYPNDFGVVYLCGAFWNAPLTGTDSKAGTLIHESSHFTLNGGTRDYAYGQALCKTLAISRPALAVLNADSHEYLAENEPVQV